MRSCASGSVSASANSTVMRRISPGCCAYAASGQAATPLPKSAMNSRRFIDAPETQDRKRRASRALFDHLVGTVLDRLRDGDAECLRSPEVDDQLDFRCLLHRKILGFLSLENPAGVDTDLTGRLRKAAAVAHKTASDGKLTKLGDRRNSVAGRQRPELFITADEECVGGDTERAGSQLGQRRENRIEVTVSAGLQNTELQAKGPCCQLHVFRYTLCNFATGRIDEKRDDSCLGHHLAQQLEPL